MIKPMLIASYLANLAGIFVFLFLFWKRQKEDFSSEIIFKLATHILTGVGLGYFVSYYFLPSVWLWLVFIGGVSGLVTGMIRLRLKFFEIFESFVISSLPWLSFIFLKDSVEFSSLSSFLGFISILLVIFISYWFDAHYKNFVWYKSGKIGFSGLATLALIFLIRFGVAIARASVLSFVGRFEIILSGLGFIVTVSTLFWLSRKD